MTNKNYNQYTWGNTSKILRKKIAGKNNSKEIICKIKVSSVKHSVAEFNKYVDLGETCFGSLKTQVKEIF